MLVCPEGHEVQPEERYCRRCGAEVAPERDSGDVVLPALPSFDPNRLRPDDVVEVRTVPVWVLVVLVILALAIGIAVGALG